MIQTETPANLYCEVTACPGSAKFIYGPECESETGKLMYLCHNHGEQIKVWRTSHLNDPVECPTHGRIGTVKNYLILKEL